MTVGRFNVLVSLSPGLSRGHPETPEGGQAYQKRCVRSWLDAGTRVISVNNASEIALLEDAYPGVLFVRCEDAAGPDNPRHLPTISEMLAIGVSLDAPVFAIANSDVGFGGDQAMLKALFEAAGGRAIVSNRHERAPTGTTVGLPYLYGYDFVLLDKEYVVPEEMKGFLIGSPWWDYLFLYMLAGRDVPLSLLTSPVIIHSTHAQAWSHEPWREGLSKVAKRVRALAAEEGPAAALLGFLCRNLEADVLPGFAANEIVTPLGIALGAAMVSYISQRCQEVVWFSSDDAQDTQNPGYPSRPNGRLRRAVYENPWSRWDQATAIEGL